MLRIIPSGSDEEPYRIPDLELDDYGVGDLVLNALSHDTQPGDFRAEQGLRSQVIICLGTDRRVDPSELRSGDENRGWVGDSFDMAQGETPLGSKLWLLRRSALYPGIETLAETYAREALQPLLAQKAVVRVDVTATASNEQNRLDLDVKLYGRDGATVFAEKFGLLWRQIDVAGAYAR
jgi:phage gp46-like protein